MIKPSMPGFESIPGMGAMTETLDFVKNLWGGMSKPGVGLPGMVMPTLSVDEIDKQIKDLKAVEAWLNLNTNMVRGTIQALEVQSATISTLQSMGQSFSAAMAPAAAASPEQAMADAAEERAAARRKSRESLAKEFKSHSGEEKRAAEKPEPKAAPKVEPKSAEKSEPKTGAMPDPSLWWNMLQDQFKQAVSSAMAPEVKSGAAKAAEKKPAAKKTAVKKTAVKKPTKPAAKKTAAKR